ncbi:MAG: hypothetical protein JSR58_02945 [Verrucomicrobia bacterium]|nr:hypothetical protein [Verrucomicrobiota bacterium]
MVRISKQAERRNQCRKRCRPPVPKTGPKKENLPSGYKAHENAMSDRTLTQTHFIAKIG